MPAKQGSVRITDAWRSRQYALVDVAVRAVRASWHNLDWEDLDGSFGRWLTASTTTVTFAQRESVRLADAYLAAYVSSELDTTVTPRGVDVDEYAGRTRTGDELRRGFAPALIAVRYAIVQRRSREEALFSGLARAVKATRSAVMDASRRALADMMRDESRVVGARRVTRGTCGACMALAGERVDEGRPLESHPNCTCVPEPIVRGVRETVQRPTGEQMWEAMSRSEQDRFFIGRGGADKAELIRTGAVALAALVARSRDGQITERPVVADHLDDDE